MKIRGLLIATIVFLALAGALYWSDHHKPSAEAAKPDADAAPSILKLDENSITKVELKKKDAAPISLFDFSREPAMNTIAIDMLSLRSILQDSPKFTFDNAGIREEDQRFDATMLSKPQMRPLPFRDPDSWFEGKPHPRPYTQRRTDSMSQIRAICPL